MPARKIAVKINGTEEIQRQLERIPMRLRDDVLTKAIKEAVKRVAQEVRAVAPPTADPDPTRPDIRRSISHGVRDDGTRIIGRAYVRARAAHAVPVEFGHVRTVYGNRLAGHVHGEMFFRRSIDKTERFSKKLIEGKVRRQVRDLIKK